MEDCMIEQPCGGCGRGWCNCRPEPEDPFEDYTLNEISMMEAAGEL